MDRTKSYKYKIVRDSKELIANNPKELEDILIKKLSNFESDISIKVSNYNDKEYDTSDLVMKIFRENPELNYGFEGVGGTQSYIPGRTERTLNVKINYRLDKQKMIHEKNAVEKKVEEIFSSYITAKMTDFEKEKVLHDYLVKNAEYDLKHVNDDPPRPEDHNPYGVLVEGTGVCEGYAKAFCVLLKRAGIECKYVTGKGNNPQGGAENHGWNMLKLDSEWYNVDVTWDDPTYAKSENQIVAIPYNYFNVTDDILNKDHTRDADSMKLPVCNSIKYSVEKQNIKEKDMTGDEFIPVESEEQLKEQITKALDNNKNKLNLKLYWDHSENLQHFLDIASNIVKSKKKTVGLEINGNKKYIIFNFK